MKNFVLFILLTIIIPGCTNDYDIGILENFSKNEQSLKIYTKVLTTQSPNFMQEFEGGSVIGLHVTSEKTSNVYKNQGAYKNVKAEAYLKNKKLNWRQSPEIMLNAEPAMIYAYYPYQEQASFDPDNIPVRISPDATLSPDYMYGTLSSGQKAVSRISPVALLNMNHALTLLGFRIRLNEKTSGYHLLKAIQVGNKAGGTSLCFRGRLNIRTGEIGCCADTNASTRLTLGTPRMLKTTLTESFQLMAIPTSRIMQEGDVEILFVIDGKTFKFKVPAQTTWKKGKRYVYSLSFNGQSFQLDTIDTSEWLPVKNENN